MLKRTDISFNNFIYLVMSRVVYETGIVVKSYKIIFLLQRQAIKELEHGRVSAEEFVQAVGEMLSGAGIRMDTKKQCLLKTTLSLQERLNESQAALVLEQVCILLISIF